METIAFVFVVSRKSTHLGAGVSMYDNRKMFFAIVLNACAPLLVDPSFAASHQTPKPQIKPLRVHTVSYMADGTPIATGAPRRLSPLAGKDSVAWSYARGGHAAAMHGKHAPRLVKQ
jgi:hypothetical protein